MTPYPSDIRPLTALRFFAACVIALFHFVNVLPFPLREYTGFADKYWLGVDFFFLLSGFILSHVYLQEFQSGTSGSGAFFIKRLARIYPLHLATLLLCAGWAIAAAEAGVAKPHFSAGAFIANLLLVQSWGIGPGFSFNLPAWSLSIEWFCYLVFPSLALQVQRYRAAPLLAFSAAIFIIIYFVSAAHYPEYLKTLRLLPEFVAGMALYRFGQARRFRYCGRAALLSCAAAIAALGHFGAPDIAIIACLGVLILIAAEQARQGAAGILNSEPLVYLGEISYSLFMIHHVVLIFMMFGLAVANAGTAVFYTAWWAGLLLLIPLSALSYHVIEKPGRRWVKQRFLKA